MTTVVESTVPEILVEDAEGFVVETVESVFVIETAPSGPDILAETLVTEVVTESSTETVYVVEPQTVLIETAEQGPPGPAHVEYPGKTITYTSGLVTEVRSYLDAAKTILAERRVLSYAGSILTSIQFFNGSGSLTKTRTLSYSGGVLSGYADV